MAAVSLPVCVMICGVTICWHKIKLILPWPPTLLRCKRKNIIDKCRCYQQLLKVLSWSTFARLWSCSSQQITIECCRSSFLYEYPLTKEGQVCCTVSIHPLSLKILRPSILLKLPIDMNSVAGWTRTFSATDFAGLRFECGMLIFLFAGRVEFWYSKHGFR